MSTRKLENREWKPYFDHFAAELEGKYVEIEVAGSAFGSQTESEWAPLTGITYDPKNDLLEIATDNIDHLISKPREIYVDVDLEGLHSVEAIDPDGNKHIIRLKSPLLLSPP